MSQEEQTKRYDQAVLVIHDVGEQRPMSTIRKFVEAVLPEHESGHKFFSKPDTMSATLELRKLQNRTQPRTHFYEYYWAYKMEGTRISHVFSWLVSLLIRNPCKVPAQLQLLWGLSWMLALAAVGCSLGPFFFSRIGIDLPRMDLVAGVASALFVALQWVAIHFVGDAARYFSSNPKNIALRQSIRADGLALLRKLCDPANNYSRVVVVGHSLGSVIAYDLLKLFWQEHYKTYVPDGQHDQPAMRKLEAAGTDLGRAGEADLKQARRQFRQAQLDLWFEQRTLNNPWLITDFISLGSPLAHGALLLAKDGDELRDRQEERELPTCPPVPDNFKDREKNGDRYSFRVWTPYDADGEKVKLNALHHAAQFACTRWTNLHFPVSNGIDGDFIGGPIAPVFGRGVEDIQVRTESPILDATPWSHTRYWHGQSRSLKPDDRGRVDSVAALKSILDDGEFWTKLQNLKS